VRGKNCFERGKGGKGYKPVTPAVCSNPTHAVIHITATASSYQTHLTWYRPTASYRK